MTATPIPRTLAMSIFGDLEMLVLDEMPIGRKPTKTFTFPFSKKSWIDKMWEKIRKEIDNGKVTFVICPKISETEEEEIDDIFFGSQLLLQNIENKDGSSDNSEDTQLTSNGQLKLQEDFSLASVKETVNELKNMKIFENIRIEGLSGKTKPNEKDEIISRFSKGETKILVSTTVVEVGIDIPKASSIVILDAQQFGLSTLHQLRGRVGRSQDESTCFLVSHLPLQKKELDLASKRLEAICSINDGFALAESDLSIRGEGDILGGKQSGVRSALKLLRVMKDVNIITIAREGAKLLLDRDPDLSNHEVLKQVIERYESDFDQDIIVKY
jgi:ATP-dependent DNA helicase RecG